MHIIFWLHAQLASLIFGGNIFSGGAGEEIYVLTDHSLFEINYSTLISCL